MKKNIWFFKKKLTEYLEAKEENEKKKCLPAPLESSIPIVYMSPTKCAIHNIFMKMKNTTKSSEK